MRKLLKDNGYKIKYISDVLGISPGQMQYRLNDPKKRFSIDELEKIAARTTLTFSDLKRACNDKNK